MFEEIKGRLAQGLAMIRQGKEIVDEARENFAAAHAALSKSDIAELDRMLAEVTTESEELSARIQRA